MTQPSKILYNLYTKKVYAKKVFQSTMIAAVANGAALNALRPVSELFYLIDGHDPLEKILDLKKSNTPVKGHKIAHAASTFEEHEDVFQEAVNMVSFDPVSEPKRSFITSKQSNESPAS
eukprot:Seg351.17 transcript_id=Seg351.17/GoldUCD/mRNA.D3Y31 product="hypothetical protein" protein_id=Seg351.17/GoldUCD/D3Y31